MNEISEQQLDEFVAGCRRVAAHGLVRCSSGNVSWRVTEQLLLITTTRSWLPDLTRDDVAICQIADGRVLNGKKPSVELGFHAGILRNRADVNVVLHCQTPCATTLACLPTPDDAYNVIPEIPFYIGPVKTVAFLLPGSDALAQTVTIAMQEHDLIQLRNHGQVTVGKDFRHAIQNAMFFELACEIILRAGDRLVPLTKMDVRNVRLLRREAPTGAM